MYYYNHNLLKLVIETVPENSKAGEDSENRIKSILDFGTEAKIKVECKMKN